MPVASSIQELIDALQTKKTKTMKALDDLFGTPQALAIMQAHPERNRLSSEPDLFHPLPAWAVAELKCLPSSTHLVQRPLSDEEIQHINDWPRENKRTLVAALDSAVESQEPLQFFWELHGENAETIDVSQSGRVFFRSPQRNVQISGWFRFLANLLANIKVKVGDKP